MWSAAQLSEEAPWERNGEGALVVEIFHAQLSPQ